MITCGNCKWWQAQQTRTQWVKGKRATMGQCIRYKWITPGRGVPCSEHPRWSEYEKTIRKTPK